MPFARGSIDAIATAGERASGAIEASAAQAANVAERLFEAAHDFVRAPKNTDVTKSVADHAELPVSLAGLRQEKSLVLEGTATLAKNIVEQFPQIEDGKLNWVFGGSVAGNLLARSRRIAFLDHGKLPADGTLQWEDIPTGAGKSYLEFARPVHDADVFTMGRDHEKSKRFGKIPNVVPDGAENAVEPEGFYWQLIHEVPIWQKGGDVAAVDVDGEPVYVVGPGQLVANKMEQSLSSRAFQGGRKYSIDFSHLYSAAKEFYPEDKLIDFAAPMLDLPGSGMFTDVMMSERLTPENVRMNNFARSVLEKYAYDGELLTTMQLDSKNSIRMIELLSRFKSGETKQSVMNFANRHSDLLASEPAQTIADPRRARINSTTENTFANEMLFSLLHRMPSGGDERYLNDMDRFLSKHSDPAPLHIAVNRNNANRARVSLMADAGDHLPFGMTSEAKSAYLREFAKSLTLAPDVRDPIAHGIMRKYDVSTDWFEKSLADVAER